VHSLYTIPPLILLAEKVKRFELPAEHNTQSGSHTPSRPHSDVSSLDEVMRRTSPQSNSSISGAASPETTDPTLVARKPNHRHQGSGGSVSLPDISEDMSEDLSRVRYLSDIVISPDALPSEVKPDSDEN
jgi:hypothetical protein